LKSKFIFVPHIIFVSLPPICSFGEQAAMHGLPVIATKNGAPVEIHQVDE
jgi:hypothetical protein